MRAPFSSRPQVPLAAMGASAACVVGRARPATPPDCSNISNFHCAVCFKPGARSVVVELRVLCRVTPPASLPVTVTVALASWACSEGSGYTLPPLRNMLVCQVPTFVRDLLKNLTLGNCLRTRHRQGCTQRRVSRVTTVNVRACRLRELVDGDGCCISVMRLIMYELCASSWVRRVLACWVGNPRPAG